MSPPPWTPSRFVHRLAARPSYLPSSCGSFSIVVWFLTPSLFTNRPPRYAAPSLFFPRELPFLPGEEILPRDVVANELYFVLRGTVDSLAKSAHVAYPHTPFTVKHMKSIAWRQTVKAMWHL